MTSAPKSPETAPLVFSVIELAELATTAAGSGTDPIDQSSILTGWILAEQVTAEASIALPTGRKR